MGTPPLFLYGSLQSEEVLKAFLQRVPSYSYALLDGFHRYEASGRPYPGLRPLAGARVVGILLDDLTPGEMELLDWFEGSDYTRQTLTVHRSSAAAIFGTPPPSDAEHRFSFSEAVEAHVYVWASEEDVANGVLSGSWDYHAKLVPVMEAYVDNCRKLAVQYKEEGPARMAQNLVTESS
ncbi:AIG2-like protein [Diplonema papillatum]|nr:AIG2-like protein [Diplonema papillatum]